MNILNFFLSDLKNCFIQWMAVDEFSAQPKVQQSKLLKDMVAVCVANMDRRCEGFSATEMPSRKPSAFYHSVIQTE